MRRRTDSVYRAFTLIELMICIAIVAIIAAIAIPEFMDKRKKQFDPEPGMHAVWQGHRVFVIAWDTTTYPHALLVRVDGGAEQRVATSELTP